MPTNDLIKDIGGITSYEIQPNGISGETEAGRFLVSVYSNAIIRIQFSINEEFEENPFSIIASPADQLGEISETEEGIQIKTDELILKINKSPFRCSYFTSEGELLSDDDHGLGIEIQGTHLSMYRTLQEGERFLGMGEKTGHLDRRGSGFTHLNTDHFAFDKNDDPLYASIPFFIGTHHGLSYGIYLDNSYRSDFNFGASNNRFSSIGIEGGDMDYYFIGGKNVQEIISNYATITGTIPLPPVWSIGYQQCRYSYYPQNEVKRLSEKFRDKKIPADVIVLDIHYMEKFKIFTWDGEKFPNPEAMIKALKEKGFEVVLICDPGIKELKGYETYDSGIREDVFIKYPDGTNYSGEVWPGWCHFPDFTAREVREWWQKKMKVYTDLGVKGYWNDMNEIATWGNMMPDNIMFEFEGQKGTTKRARNIYGFQMARASYESTKNLTNERPFTLTRAGFAGVQRYSALWTGDNISNDEHMLLAVRMILSLGMSGIPFAGSDIGGFVGSIEGRLFSRWIQIAAFTPFFRSHTVINSNSAEPWSFGEEVEEISTNFIRLRYKLLPYLYQTFRQASIDGTPVNRSLAIDHTSDDRVYSKEFENQFFFGDSVLVAPLESNQTVRKVFLPKGDWYEFFTGEFTKGDRTFFQEVGYTHLPVYVKSSSIVPMYPEIGQHTRHIGKTLDIHIYHGEETCEFDYYEDDGTTFEFESGGFYSRKIKYSPASNEIEIGSPEGTYPSKIKTIQIWIHGADVSECTINKKSVDVERRDLAFTQPISNFDPMVFIDENAHSRNRNLPFIQISNESEKLTIKLIG